jgi:hypothetical protein
LITALTDSQAKMLVDWENDHLSISETAASESRDNQFSNPLCFVVISDNLDFDIGRFFDIPAPTVLRNSPLGGASSFDFEDGYARKFFGCYGLSDIIGFATLNNRFDLLHLP